MNEITSLLACLHTIIDRTTLRRLTVITHALLTMIGRVSMLGISRWSEKGGRYRTVQRFFCQRIPWAEINWALISQILQKIPDVILVTGDITVVTKAGKQTFGLGRFFSSIYSKTVPGLAFQTLSLTAVGHEKSWPILIEQVLPQKKKAKKATQPKKKKIEKRQCGRPKGSKNKNRREVELNTEFSQLQVMLKRLLQLIGGQLNPGYFVYDGAAGNNPAVQMTRQVGLHLISKLRHDSALHLPWQGQYRGKGPRNIYGDRVDYQNLPKEHLKSEKTVKQVCTYIYQLTGRHKKFADPLNIVIIVKENLATGKKTHIILFSTDLQLEREKVIQYYRLRFQIEFNFREAKQYWGLEDFMVIGQQEVTNAANLSLWMVNLSQRLRLASGESSVIDLKAHDHGSRYAREVFKLLPKNVGRIIIGPLSEIDCGVRANTRVKASRIMAKVLIVRTIEVMTCFYSVTYFPGQLCRVGQAYLLVGLYRPDRSSDGKQNIFQHHKEA